MLIRENYPIQYCMEYYIVLSLSFFPASSFKMQFKKGLHILLTTHNSGGDASLQKTRTILVYMIEAILIISIFIYLSIHAFYTMR